MQARGGDTLQPENVRYFDLHFPGSVGLDGRKRKEMRQAELSILKWVGGRVYESGNSL